MGTTSEKLTYLNTTKSELKQAINNLGGNIDSETTFREYVEELQDVYDKAPKTTFQTGTDITISNGLKAKLDFEKVYQEVEYIESTGTQYIDTGLNADSNLKIDMDMQYTSGGTADYTNTFGAIVNGGAKRLHFAPNNVGAVMASYANNLNVALFTKDYRTRYNTIIDFKNKTVVTYVDGETVSSQLTNSDPYDLNINFWLFRRNGDTPDLQYFCYMRVYSFKMYSNEVLVRDFVPCYRKSDNVIGLYDRVNGKFYENLGTGTFVKGSNIGNGMTDIVGIGQAKQTQTDGYNIFDENSYSYNGDALKSFVKYKNGMKLTSNDGLTNNQYGRALVDTSNLFDNTKQYTASCDVIVDKNCNALFGWYSISTTNPVHANIPANVKTHLTVGIPIGSTATYFSIGVFGPDITAVFENIQIVEGSVDKTYEEFSNNQPSPSPSFFQDVKTIDGKNKLATPYTYPSQIRDGITFTINPDGSVTANGTSTGNATFLLQTNDANLRKLLLRNSCVLSGCPSGGSSSTYKLQLYGYNSNGAGALVDTGEGVDLSPFVNQNNSFNVAILILTGTTVNNLVFKPMIEVGKKATEYVPYKVIKEIIQGKNLLIPTLTNNGTSIIINNISNASVTNGEFSFTASGLDMYFGNVRPAGQEYIDNRGIKVYKNGHEKISFKLSNSSLGRTYITAYNSSGISLGYTEIASAQGTYTFPDNCDFVSFRFGTDGATVGTTYKTTIMVAYGDTIPTYEPYVTPKTYQFSLGDHKFYGIGEVEDLIITDRTTKKWYKYGQFSKINLKDCTWEYNGNDQRAITHDTENIIKKSADNNTIANIMSDIGKASAVNALILSSGKSLIGVSTHGHISYKSPNYTSLSDYETMFTNTNAYAIIQLAKPSVTEITGTLAEQLETWYNAHSLNGTTIITSNGDLPIIVKVRSLKGE